MPGRQIDGREVRFDERGFLSDPSQWTEALARALAAEEGLGELSERHFLVLRFMRGEFIRRGFAPALRRLARETGVSIAELYELFPGGPAKQAARIAGIPGLGCV